MLTKSPIQPQGDDALFLEIIGQVNRDLSITEHEHTIFPDVEVHKGKDVTYESFSEYSFFKMFLINAKDLELYDKMVQLINGKYKYLFY